jgi:hypothetical protein
MAVEAMPPYTVYQNTEDYDNRSYESISTVSLLPRKDNQQPAQNITDTEKLSPKNVLPLVDKEVQEVEHQSMHTNDIGYHGMVLQD